MESSCKKVCVTGGSGYIGSWLVKKLLEKGHTVHATLRNLGDTSKVSFLKSLPNADARLVLFQADIYNPDEFELAIKGCEFVFHVATPMLHSPQSTQYKDTTEAAVAGVKSIADSCVRSQTVKRLIYTASVMASSPLKEDGFGFKSCLDESCWTPLNLSYQHSNDFMMAYVKSKTLAEKEVLSYNEDENSDQLEVVTLACGLVVGGTLQNYPSTSIGCVLSQLTGNLILYEGLRFLQEMLGTIPLIHIDDVCEAHIFCMEKPVMKGRFLCSAVNATINEIADFYCENYPEFKITEEYKTLNLWFTGGVEGPTCKWDYTKLVKEGFEYKYELKKIVDDSVETGRRLGVFSA
ncbi:Anthocyanidin reductase ((2S)-flavan-3-ol-forming) [Vitis vinifera]|uniref:Anthocyanidin reductase ((2S)-flavan-3-ol-forming) n=1 Tax=Vitis vinifera TaxID=29760 RepID=A0A438J4Z6_VITVI|nr:Anthocyanidin reductase ((2S)-flavan-3-ol-forming) [Vitis vinifera]